MENHMEKKIGQDMKTQIMQWCRSFFTFPKLGAQLGGHYNEDYGIFESILGGPCVWKSAKSALGGVCRVI